LTYNSWWRSHVVSCLMKCKSERTCISIRSLAVLRDFEDLQSHSRQAVLQIMICGLHKEWKQLVVCYMFQRSMKGEMLINLLTPATLQPCCCSPDNILWPIQLLQFLIIPYSPFSCAGPYILDKNFLSKGHTCSWSLTLRSVF
jgi:hypothetical protein